MNSETDGPDPEFCPKCYGEGLIYIPVSPSWDDPGHEITQPCSACNGSGYVDAERAEVSAR